MAGFVRRSVVLFSKSSNLCSKTGWNPLFDLLSIRFYSPRRPGSYLPGTPVPVGTVNYKDEDMRFVLPKYKEYNDDSHKIIPHETVTKMLMEEMNAEERKVAEWLQRIKTDTKTYSVVAIPTAEKYDLRRLKAALHKQGLYIPCEIANHTKSNTIGGSEAIHAVGKHNPTGEYRHIYFFKDGCVVFWNCPQAERAAVAQHLESFEEFRYDLSLILRETDTMEYVYNPSLRTSYIKNGVIHIAAGHSNLEELCLDRYTFSNAMALSAMLGVMEGRNEDFVKFLEGLTNDLKDGNPIRSSRDGILRNIGQVYHVRHFITLATDLLDVPDFYWDKDDKEQLFNKSTDYFNINRRTKALSDKLTHCTELIELVRHHLGDTHHIRLEWMIIILIMVEVFFELVHWADRLGIKINWSELL